MKNIFIILFSLLTTIGIAQSADDYLKKAEDMEAQKKDHALVLETLNKGLRLDKWHAGINLKIAQINEALGDESFDLAQQDKSSSLKTDTIIYYSSAYEGYIRVTKIDSKKDLTADISRIKDKLNKTNAL
ncbi:MAG: hypothetical protein HRT68_14740 [Flavobacteriaceae bacterium]|nr:hypothetical protein [Flavobacteriaceae bacterium]